MFTLLLHSIKIKLSKLKILYHDIIKNKSDNFNIVLFEKNKLIYMIIHVTI